MKYPKLSKYYELSFRAFLTLISLMAFLLFSMIFCNISYAQDIYVSPADTNVTVGQTVNIVIEARSVTDLSTFEFRISFNRDVLSASGIAKGDIWSNSSYLWHAGDIDNGTGTIGFTSGAAASESSPVGVSIDSNGGALANISFQAIAAGSSAISLTDVYMAKVNGDEIHPNVINGLVSASSSASSISLALLDSSSGSNKITVNKGDEFDLQVRINTSSMQVNSAAIYITFDSSRLQLAGDQYPDVPGIQPFFQGEFIGAGDKNWIVNTVNGSKLDYAEGRISGTVSGDGLMATVRFMAIDSTPSTTVSFDFDMANARNTEIGIPDAPYTVVPDPYTNAEITINIPNSPPSATNLAIAPASPLTADDLTGSYTYSDPEENPETAKEIRWYKNDILQPDLGDQLIVPASATAKGDKWHFTVRVSDGSAFGELATSAPVTIGNAPPSAVELSVSPASPGTLDDLAGRYTYSDPDGDVESGSEIKWYRNDILQPDYINQMVIPASVTSKGEAWYFTVVPGDGTDNGSMQTSPSSIINNSQPTASSFAITPESPSTNDSLVGTYEYNDPDGDADRSELKWYKNSILQSDYNNQLTIPSTATSRGETWYFTVLPNDGTESGVLQTSPSVVIVNLPPTASDLAISPATPSSTNDLTGSYSYADADGDSEGKSEIKWYKTDVHQAEYDNKLTVPAIATSKGETWHFTVKPYDSLSYGELQTSAKVTIINTPPSASNLAISPASPRAIDDLTAAYTYSDPEGDAQTGSEIRWYKNNSLQPEYNDKLTIPYIAIKKNQTWYFTVKPYDGSDYGSLQTSPSVKILNSLPVVKTSDQYSSIVDNNTAFTSDGTIDPDGDALIYKWDFDANNGTSDADSTDPNPNYAYTQIGTYTATLVVSDDEGSSEPVSSTVDVKVDINGNAKLQGHGTNPAKVNIAVRPVGSKTALKTFDVDITNGLFNILTDITPGTYDITAKAKHYLKAIARNVNISGNKEDAAFDPEIAGIASGELRGGDCNSDNAVTLADFSLLSKYFGKVADSADINGDGLVNILDFSIFSANFGYIGVDGRSLAPSKPSDIGSNGSVKLIVYTDRDPKTISPGDEFDVYLRADSASKMKGYSTILQYDTEAFQLVDTAKEGAFLKSNREGRSTLFISKASNGGYESNLMLSGCIVDETQGVSGGGILASLRFRLSNASPGSLSIYQPSIIDSRERINNLADMQFTLQTIPKQMALLPNYPNPFNPETWIPYELSDAADVKIEIFNVTGQLIRSLNLGHKQPGFYVNKERAAYWDGKNEIGEEVSSGIYFYTIRTADYASTRKMTIVR